MTASRAWSCEVRHNHRSLSLVFFNQAGRQSAFTGQGLGTQASLVTTSFDITSEFTSPDITFWATPKWLEVVRLRLLMSSGSASHVDRNRP